MDTRSFGDGPLWYSRDEHRRSIACPYPARTMTQALLVERWIANDQPDAARRLFRRLGPDETEGLIEALQWLMASRHWDGVDYRLESN